MTKSMFIVLKIQYNLPNLQLLLTLALSNLLEIFSAVEFQMDLFSYLIFRKEP